MTVVRNAFVAEYAETRPALALSVWPDHPRAELWSALTDIAKSARAGRPVSPLVLRSVNDAARKDPLAAEPFLVHGIEQRLDGNETLAAISYEAAELRDGRSVPARYFLADHYLRVGDAADGLRETAMLARMVPNGVPALAPFVAAYAKDPANWAQLSAMFRSNVPLGNATLTVLARDPGNADLVLRLANPSPRGAPPPWVAELVSSLVSGGDYVRAYQIWRNAAHPREPTDSLLYDSAFRDSTTPGPFNWTLTSSSLGLAERQSGGRLHIVYYAQDDGVLATQLLVLPPGRYRLAMNVSGDLRHLALLNWLLTCPKSSGELLRLGLAASTQGSFDVPRGCGAQRLDLVGSAPDLAQAVDVTISNLNLTRVQSGD